MFTASATEGPDMQQLYSNGPSTASELAQLYGNAVNTSGGADVESGTATGHTKLFIGQIPKSVDEAYLQPFFSSFGVVSELIVIRDKNDMSTHQGAAFVTYQTMEAAALAVENLHDKIRLPNVSPRTPSPLLPPQAPRSKEAGG